MNMQKWGRNNLIQMFFIATFAFAVLSIPIFAEDTAISELQSSDQKIATIEAQIDELNKKVDTAKDSEIDKIFSQIEALEEQKTQAILASKDAELTQLKRKTAQQEKILVEEKEKTQQAFDRVGKQLDSIQETLSSQEKTDKK